jgi:hypothetical protein
MKDREGDTHVKSRGAFILAVTAAGTLVLAWIAFLIWLMIKALSLI